MSDIKLNERARAYAKYQLDKRRAAQDRGESVGGIMKLLQRAFFHGWVDGKKEAIEEMTNNKGVKPSGE